MKIQDDSRVMVRVEMAESKVRDLSSSESAMDWNYAKRTPVIALPNYYISYELKTNCSGEPGYVDLPAMLWIGDGVPTTEIRRTAPNGSSPIYVRHVAASLRQPANINIALAATIHASTVDGVVVSSIGTDVVVLLTGQTATDQNGVYISTATTFTRHPDFDTGADFSAGTAVDVGEGTLYAGKSYGCNSKTITFGDTSIIFNEVGSINPFNYLSLFFLRVVSGTLTSVTCADWADNPMGPTFGPFDAGDFVLLNGVSAAVEKQRRKLIFDTPDEAVIEMVIMGKIVGP